MAKEKFDYPKDVVPAALQFLIFDRFKRLDGEFDWKGEIWKFSAYKISEPVNLIRIDLRKKESPKKPSKGV